ncbi:MAG: uncharacterized membrane protein YkvA (DUF1232 family) [Candidatus Omnitrophota bacterium]|jgi:uncharacterized membrane protein YkvA (DUF1232 family)
MAEKSEKKSAKKKPAKKSTAKKGSSKKTTGKKKSTDLEARLEVPVKLENEEKALDFYQKLRKKIKKQLKNRSSETKGKGAEYDKLVEALALLPDFFHLSVKLLFDKNVPAENKGALVAGIAYVVSPIDLVPDFIFIAGWLDDLIVLTMALNKFLETDNKKVQAAIKKHWAGEGDALEVVQQVLKVGDEAIKFLPRQFMDMVKPLFHK